jgi:hypothetical protein
VKCKNCWEILTIENANDFFATHESIKTQAKGGIGNTRGFYVVCRCGEHTFFNAVSDIPPAVVSKCRVKAL